MRRIEALTVIDSVFADRPLVATCGATARELASLARRPNHLYLLDSMGLTCAVGLGIALGHPGPVGVIDGDGSLLMGFSIVATLATVSPSNLTVIVLDNGQHASAAGIPSQAGTLDLSKALSGLPITQHLVEDVAALEAALRLEITSDHLSFVIAKTEPGNSPGVPFLLEDPAVLSAVFTSFLDSDPR